MTTPNLALPEIAAAQAQKHVTHNEALRILDALVQLAVLDRDLTAPPASPAEGDRYIVAAGATGDWAGHDGEVTVYADGAWSFLIPREGWLATAADEDMLVRHDGSAWGPAAAGDVVGPNGGVADGDAVLFDGTTGKLVKGAGGAPLLKSGATMTGALAIAQGTAAAPGLPFDGDSNTGLYWIGAARIGVAVGGVKVAEFKSTGIIAARPILRAQLGAGQTISASTQTLLDLSTASLENELSWDTVNKRFNVLESGNYRLTGCVMLNAQNVSTGDQLDLTARLNGSTALALGRTYFNGQGVQSAFFSRTTVIAAGNYVDVSVQSNGTGDRVVSASGYFTFFEVERV